MTFSSGPRENPACCFAAGVRGLCLAGAPRFAVGWGVLHAAALHGALADAAGLPVLVAFPPDVSVCTEQDVWQFYGSWFVWLITFPMFLLGFALLPFS